MDHMVESGASLCSVRGSIFITVLFLRARSLMIVSLRLKYVSLPKYTCSLRLCVIIFYSRPKSPTGLIYIVVYLADNLCKIFHLQISVINLIIIAFLFIVVGILQK